MLTAAVGAASSRLSRVTSAPASGAGESAAADSDYISRRATAAMRARELRAIRAESARLHSRTSSGALASGNLAAVADATPRRHSATAALNAEQFAVTAAADVKRSARGLGPSQKNAARAAALAAAAARLEAEAHMTPNQRRAAALARAAEEEKARCAKQSLSFEPAWRCQRCQHCCKTMR